MPEPTIKEWTMLLGTARYTAEQFGQLIKERRAALPKEHKRGGPNHLSSQTLAHKLGIDPVKLHHTEAGRMLLDEAELARLLDWLTP